MPEATFVIGLGEVLVWHRMWRHPDYEVRTSAVGGRADLACQELSGPFLAKSGHLKLPHNLPNGAMVEP